VAKNPAASAMAKSRWANVSKEERSKQMKKLAKKRWAKNGKS
jgi:hypothetical protein